MTIERAKGTPASPIRRHIARSSSQIAVASTCSRSHIAAPPQWPGVSAATRAMRSSAQRRFTAVGRVAPSSCTSSASRARKRSRAAPRGHGPPVESLVGAAYFDERDDVSAYLQALDRMCAQAAPALSTEAILRGIHRGI